MFGPNTPLKVITILFVLKGVVGFSFYQIQDSVAFKYRTSDEVLITINEQHDSLGILEGYTSLIASPICEKGECYEVELKYFWDVLGNFKTFEVLPNKPLTKLDHEPFTENDYLKFHQILLTKAPSFMHLRRAELVSKQKLNVEDGVDAVSGATLEYIKKDMVEGAIYTCYSLWHIANGDINFQLQEHTKNSLNKALVRAMLELNNVEFHYFLIENMDAIYFELFIDEIVAISKKYDSYFSNRVRTKLPDNLKMRLESH